MRVVPNEETGRNDEPKVKLLRFQGRCEPFFIWPGTANQVQLLYAFAACYPQVQQVCYSSTHQSPASYFAGRKGMRRIEHGRIQSRMRRIEHGRISPGCVESSMDGSSPGCVESSMDGSAQDASNRALTDPAR